MNIASKTWTKISSSAPTTLPNCSAAYGDVEPSAPSAREGAGMAINVGGSPLRLFLFGGDLRRLCEQNNPDGYPYSYDDLWYTTIATANAPGPWVQISGNRVYKRMGTESGGIDVTNVIYEYASPPPRSGAYMGFDKNGKLILYGGNAFYDYYGARSTAIRNDMWELSEFNEATNKYQWKLLSGSSTPNIATNISAPLLGSRSQFGAEYVSSLDALFVLGGCEMDTNNNNNLVIKTDLWKLSYACPRGYSGPVGVRDCELCAENTYKSVLGNGVCNACSAESYTDRFTPCKCYAGYELNVVGACAPCERGFYKPFNDSISDKCVRCTNVRQTTLNTGSTSIQDCITPTSPSTTPTSPASSPSWFSGDVVYYVIAGAAGFLIIVVGCIVAIVRSRKASQNVKKANANATATPGFPFFNMMRPPFLSFGPNGNLIQTFGGNSPYTGPGGSPMVLSAQSSVGPDQMLPMLSPPILQAPPTGNVFSSRNIQFANPIPQTNNIGGNTHAINSNSSNSRRSETGDNPEDPEATLNKTIAVTQVMNRNILSYPAFMEFSPDTQVQKLKKIGEGGFGELFEVTIIDSELSARAKSRKGALKLIKEDTEKAKIELQQEVSIIYCLQSCENIVRLFGCSRAPRLSILCKLYKCSLAQFIHSKRNLCHLPWDADIVSALAADVANGLKAMHACGMAHLDIKPSNILVDEVDLNSNKMGMPYRLVLTDFGLTRVLEKTEDVKGRKVATVKGISFNYASPEAFKVLPLSKAPNPAVYMKVDVFALAMTLFELITKTLPWEGLKMDEVEARLGTCERPEYIDKISATGPLLDPLLDLMKKMWEQEWESRPDMDYVSGVLVRLVQSRDADRMPVVRLIWSQVIAVRQQTEAIATVKSSSGKNRTALNDRSAQSSSGQQRGLTSPGGPIFMMPNGMLVQAPPDFNPQMMMSPQQQMMLAQQTAAMPPMSPQLMMGQAPVPPQFIMSQQQANQQQYIMAQQQQQQQQQQMQQQQQQQYTRQAAQTMQQPYYGQYPQQQ